MNETKQNRLVLTTGEVAFATPAVAAFSFFSFPSFFSFGGAAP
jgi:hypothetical protein